MVEGINIKILLTDDERTVRDVFGAYLNNFGFTVIPAENGHVCLELFEKEKPDIVLLDLKMPVLNGIETLEKLNERYPDTPVIIISGEGLVGDVVRALRLVAWDYIIKPVIDMSILTHSIEKALERMRLIEENRVYQEKLEELVRLRTCELDSANEELNTINSRLREIVSSATEISSCSRISDFGELLIREFSKHMDASGGSLYLLEDGGLRLLYSLDSSHCPEYIAYPLNEGSVLQKTITGRKSLLIDDVMKDETCRLSGWDGYMNDSILTFPLTGENGRIIAVLSLHNRSNPPFIQQDQEVGMILTTYSSEALRSIRAVEDLRESENRYRKLFNNARDAIFLWELNENDRPGYCIDANKVAVEMTGYSREELLRLKPRDLTHDYERDNCPSLLHDFIKSKFATFERIYKTKSGGKVPVEINSHIFSLKKRRVILSITRDITKRKEAEKKIKESLREKELMLKEIHHRVKNNIQIIISILNLQSEKIKNREDLEYFMESENRVRSIALVHEMLYSSESLSNINFNNYITSLVEQIENFTSCREKNIEIKVNAENQLIGIESAIPCALIVNELIINAVKYAFPETKGGAITINFSCRDGTYALIVTDDGPGFHSDYDFEKSESLGLRMVNELVKQLKGRIDIESGKGVRISVIFGEGVERQPGDTASMYTGTDMNGKRLLLVEDERITVLHIRNILANAGYPVLDTVSSGEEALEIIKRYKPDIILMDIILDGKLDGIDTVEIILKEYKIPVIYLTANTDMYVMERAMKTQPFGYLPKPIERDQMVSMIKKGLSKKQ
jgi:PAS domain S-box-containing protein